jgi:phenylpyruvate tautomerase
MRHLVLALLACASSRANALRLSLTVHPARSSSRTSGTSLIASADAVDPSLVLNTNVVLSDKKRFLKAASAAIAAAFSKPEQYVAVCVTDKLDLLFGGSDAPCAIGCVYSIGEINQKNNAALTAAIADLLFAYGGIHDDRIYLNFFDVPPANCDCDCLELSAASSCCSSCCCPLLLLLLLAVAAAPCCSCCCCCCCCCCCFCPCCCRCCCERSSPNVLSC